MIGENDRGDDVFSDMSHGKKGGQSAGAVEMWGLEYPLALVTLFLRHEALGEGLCPRLGHHAYHSGGSNCQLNVWNQGYE